MKKIASIIPLSIGLLILATGITYGIGFALKLPIPFVNDGVYKPNYVEQNQLMDKWASVRIYKPTVEKVQEIVKEAPEVKVDSSAQDFLKTFDEIDQATFNTYMTAHKDLATNGYTKLLIDKVDVSNTPTGIKTVKGNDVLAIDAYDNIIIAGLDVNGQKAKLAIVKNKQQVGLSVVDNLTYWDEINVHAQRENAILAVNASGYTWNNTGAYGTLFGLAVRNGDLIRKANDTQNSIGFTKEGKLQVGTSTDSLYNACEFSPGLIKGGVVTYNGTDNAKAARTAIGQTADGDILLLVVNGDDSTKGATVTDLLNIMKNYGAVDAATLSNGLCSVMWWNGKVVTTPFNGTTNGVKLPTAWVVKPATK